MPRERAAAMAALAQVAADLDRESAARFAAAQASSRPEDRPACRRGCAFCCHQLVPLTSLEAARIADFVSSRPRTERRRLVAAVEQQSRRFAAWVQSRGPTDVRDRATNLDYLRQGIPCPFLGPEKECQVYPVRPLICRGHHALESSAACRSGEGQIRTIPALDRATSRAVAEARDLTSVLGITPPGGLISTFAPMFKAALNRGG